MINLSALTVVEKSNSRGGTSKSRSGKKARPQYDFRLLRTTRKVSGTEKVVSLFHVSDEMFEKLDLQNQGLVQIGEGQEICLAVVSEDDATILKGRIKDGNKLNKTKYFNSNILDADLLSAGTIGEEMKNHGMNMVFVEGSVGAALNNGKVAVGGVYHLVKAEGESEADQEVAAPSPISEEPQTNSGSTLTESPVASNQLEVEEFNDDDL